jgi:hypothetical protein
MIGSKGLHLLIAFKSSRYIRGVSHCYMLLKPSVNENIMWCKSQGISGIEVKHVECVERSCGVRTAYYHLDQVRLTLRRIATVLWSDMASIRSSILRGWSSGEVTFDDQKLKRIRLTEIL